MKQILIAGAVGAIACLLAPTATIAQTGYYEWSTKRPFSGWVGTGRRNYYCDYIKYPVRKCSKQRVCKSGRCWWKENCRTVGWDIRQTCY